MKVGWNILRFAVPNEVCKQTAMRDKISEDIFHFAEMRLSQPETIQSEH
jgi:hypothetical protein